MCWEVFNKTRSRRLASEESASKIIQFGLYAWGIPLLLLALVLVLEYSLPRNHPINPGFGAHMCWFQTSGYGSWIYYNALTIGLLAGNFILFTMTITTLVKHERESRNVTSTREKTKCWIYFRLWLIMGLSWLLEYLSLFLDNDSWLTLIADIFNVLQGVFLCYIFMINKSKLKEIRRSLKRVSQSSIITQVTSRSKNSSFSVSKKSSSSAGGALNRGFEHQNSQSSQGKKTASSSVKTKPSVGTSESSAQARANSCPEVEIATGNEKKVVMQDESEQNDTAV
ncbi:unnamed protein product [Cyprideis torosa]|uniref:Uncharacterized protein n=1 Tax=Cyprideis torosa TaxID=163714 RepID=A0A7R8ZMW3_9CRUS|nr:unnamed protein product [Cyprideis torosa]CAG0890024.1 unnamed protein product [Cyprideis torosa]